MAFYSSSDIDTDHCFSNKEEGVLPVANPVSWVMQKYLHIT